MSSSWSWSLKPGGVGVGTGAEQTVSAETQLLGVEKPEVSGRVSELLPSVQE